MRPVHVSTIIFFVLLWQSFRILGGKGWPMESIFLKSMSVMPLVEEASYLTLL